MTLQKLLNTIGFIGVQDKLVNFTGCGGSVYELNDLSIHNYPILYCSPTGTHRVEENYTTYSIVLFYIDRLLEDNSNAVDIHSAAVEILKNIIRAIKNTDGVIGVSDEYSINLFTETEKFKDRCNGAYATVEISVVNDTICEVGYGDNMEPGTNRFLRFTYPTESVVYIPYLREYESFVWETSEPYTHYVVHKFVEGEPESIVMEGDTESTSIGLSTGVNSGTSVISYEVQISNEGGNDTRTLNHLPYYFLNYVNRDYSSVEANAQNYLISWETNLENVEWKLYRNDTLYSSGQTTNTSIQVEFPVNTSDESVAYRFVAGYPGGGFEKTLNFSQNEAKSYYVRADDYLMLPNESAVTIDFETNCEGDIRFEWAYWNGTDAIRLNDTTWTYGTPKSIVATAPAERGNTYQTSMYARAYYNGEIVGWVTVDMRNYYFNLLTEDNLKIGSTATSFTINYETNYPEVPYEMAGVGTGVTSGGTLTITFNENTGTTPVAMEIMFRNTGGNVLGTLHWSQNPVDAYFNILTASGQTIPAAATSFTINYETNMTPPYAYSYTNPEGETIWGNAWDASALTINFNPNGGYSVLERSVRIALKDINWYQEAASQSGDTNSAITSDYVIGNPIKDIDEIVPYGYYVMRWDNEGTYGKLTRALSNEYVTDRRMSTFIDAHVDNGIIHAADAQRIRILQAIPKGDTEISGTTLYGKDSNGSEFVYTGASYLFYDIYTGKYFSWNGANGAEHLDMQVFLQYPEKSALVWNYLNASADGNRIGMRGGNIASDGSWLPFKRVLDGVDCMAGTEQRANSQYPYNYPSGWNDVKISIIPITEVQ